MNSDAASPPGGPDNQTEVGTNGAEHSAVADAQTPDSTPRWHQIFPVLTDAEIDRINRFGAIHRYAAGEFLYRAGGMSPGSRIGLKSKSFETGQVKRGPVQQSSSISSGTASNPRSSKSMRSPTSG
ncbi:hypothetical protein P3T23_003302 [Paraburkholderia sp. GAS448]